MQAQGYDHGDSVFLGVTYNSKWDISRMTSKSLFKGGGVRDELQMRAKMATDKRQK